MNGNSKSIPDRLRPHFSTLLFSCRDICVSRLTALLKDMFKEADTALLEFADKAQSDMIQARFIEAIRIVNSKHETIEKTFQQEIANGFVRFAARNLGSHRGLSNIDGDTLSLVAKDDAEEAIAVQNLSQKALSKHAEAVYSLGQRLAVVNGGSKVDDAFMPGGPLQIAKAYQTALRGIEVHHTVRIMLYALFDKCVMKDLGNIYEDINNALIQGGVLKNLKSSVVKQANNVTDIKTNKKEKPGQKGQGDAPATAVGGDIAQGAKSMEQELFDSIRELLSKKNLASGHGSAEAGGGSGSGHYTPEEIQQATGTLLTSIGGLQHIAVTSEHAQLTRKGSKGYQAIDQSALDNIKASLNDERSAMYHGVDRRKIPALEQNVIELVGMMFDYMLSDEQLPNAVKALLSRLHTPFLKIAIIDKDFFTRSDNPARNLLNYMASVGVRWVSDKDLEYGLYPLMLATVERILLEFDNEIGLFEQVLQDFQQGVTRHTHKVEQIEQRTLEAARGGERLEAARMRASQAIGKAIGTRRLIPSAMKFLHDTWQDKLMFIHLRCGDEQHTDCETALSVTNRMIEALDLCVDAEQRDKVRDALPGLQDELHAELQRLADYGMDDLDAIYARVVELQQESLNTAPSNITAEACAAFEAEHEEKNKQVTLTADEQTVWDELGTVEFGTWFEFHSDTSDGFVRLKLAWHSRITNNFMFVNQAGVRTSVIPRLDLTREMLAGKIRFAIEEKQPFVDRAMAMIRKFLHKVVPESTGKPAQALS